MRTTAKAFSDLPTKRKTSREGGREEALSSTLGHLPKPASWEEREDGGAVLPTMGLTTAGEPGPRSIKLSSVTSLSTCQDMRLSEVSPGAMLQQPHTDLHALTRKGIKAVQPMEDGSPYPPEGFIVDSG